MTDRFQPFRDAAQCSFTCHRKDLYTKLASASFDSPGEFSVQALDIIREVLPLRAASLYRFNAASDVLALRAQSGLDYQTYQEFELPLNTLAGKAVQTRTVHSVQNVRSSNEYRDTALLEKYQLYSMLTVPLAINVPTQYWYPTPLGVLCAYPEAKKDIAGLSASLSEAAPFIARLYLASLESMKMRLRTGLVERSAYSTDTGSLLHRALRVLQDELHIEAASVFLLDERNDFLRMRGVTRLPKNIRREDIFLMPKSEDPTYLTLGEGKSRRYREPFDAFGPNERLEVVAGARRECLCFPIRQAAVAPGDTARSIGVLRVFNKQISHEGRTLPGWFSWEDIALLDFYTEMLAILVHAMHRRTAGEDDFERMMHGAKRNLHVAIQNLELMESRGAITERLPAELAYTHSNAIAALSDIEAQIERQDLRHTDDLELQPIQLWGAVLAKMPALIKRGTVAEEIPRFTIVMNEDGLLQRLPEVQGNLQAVFCIFRNIVDNAVKYARTDGDGNRIEFEVSVHKETVNVRVTDFGIGIPACAVPYIFVDGYRAPNAQARNPSGIGMGLADVRELARKMGGDVRYVDGESGSTFEVILLKASAARKNPQ